jgi:hypothetical protein
LDFPYGIIPVEPDHHLNRDHPFVPPLLPKGSYYQVNRDAHAFQGGLAQKISLSYAKAHFLRYGFPLDPRHTLLVQFKLFDPDPQSFLEAVSTVPNSSWQFKEKF